MHSSVKENILYTVPKNGKTEGAHAALGGKWDIRNECDESNSTVNVTFSWGKGVL